MTPEDYEQNPNLLDGTVYAVQFGNGELFLTVAGRDDRPYIIHFDADQAHNLQRIVAQVIERKAA